MKRVWLVLGLILMIIILSACAAGPNELQDHENEDGEVAGFWRGLWHGMIFPITFIISLFNKNVSVYEIFNNGGWYDFGFFLGLTMSIGGSGTAAGSSRNN